MLQAITRFESSQLADVHESMALSPIEQVFTGVGACPITFTFSFTAALDAAALQRSLAVALRSFPLLQARLVEGGWRTLALTRDPLVGILRVRSDADAIDARVDGQLGSETARFTLTQERTGSLLTVSMSHAVVDGFAFMHFMYNWARIARGLPAAPVSRNSIDACPSATPVSPASILADCGAFWLEGQKRCADQPLRVVHRRFELAELASERAEARRSHGASLTDNDLICAHLWRQFCPRDADPHAATFLTCPIDARPLCRQLGRSHFGCAITFASAGLRVEQLSSAPLAELALAIRKAVGAVDEGRVRASMQALASLRAQRGAGALDEVHLTHPTHGLLVTNLTRLPLDGLDFGSGAPSAFEADGQLPRCAVLFSCPGGVEARVYLPA